MKKIRVLSIALVLLMVLPMLFACGGTSKGDGVEFNITVKTFVDPDAGSATEKETGAEETKETKEPEAYEDVLFSGAVAVYVAEGKDITVKDVVQAYVDEQNSDYVFDEDLNMFTKIDGISKAGGNTWYFVVNGDDNVRLDTVVTPEQEIQICYGK